MEGRAAKLVVRLGAAFTLVFLYLPLAVIFIYAFNESVAQAWPPTGFTTRWFEVAWNSPDVKESLLNSVDHRSGRGCDRGGARVSRRVRGPPVPVLRAGDDLVRAGAADRAARHHHRDGAAVGLQHDGRQALVVHDHDRARDVLRRRGVQQRGGAPATDVRVDRRGVDGPGSRRVADVPPRDAPDDRDGARRRRPARVRAVVRRDHRHELRLGRGAHAAEMDLQHDPAPEEPAGGQRRRLHRDRSCR